MGFHDFLNFVYHFFIIISVLVIVSGFFYTIYKIIFDKNKVTPKEAIRNYFDSSILVGLQILIVADIIETIIAPDLISTMRVFAVVIIRTIMSFSLHWELKNDKN